MVFGGGLKPSRCGFASNVHRTTRATALERNRLVIALAAEHVVPYVKEQSPLAELLCKGEEKSC